MNQDSSAAAPSPALRGHPVDSMGAGARRTALIASGLKYLLLLTFFIAYLNAMLRPSQDSVFTAFRVILPPMAVLVLMRYMNTPAAPRLLLYIAAVFFYSLVQMVVNGWLSEAFVWSYLANIIAASLFVHFVFWYQQSHGRESLLRHLYFWYSVIVAASFHQLATGFTYPNMDQKYDVARIFFGQENDTSLALAAFVPVLLARCRRDPIALVLLILGVVIIYINNTRGMLLALAGYIVLVLGFRIVNSKLFARFRLLRPLIAAVIGIIIVTSVFVLKDAPIQLEDHQSSLTEMVIDPIAEMAAGQMMDAELTSINLRVTLAIVGVQEYLKSFGFGIGPGASTFFVREYYPDIALGMHMFPLQLLVENGWLFVATLIWIVRVWSPRQGAANFWPPFLFFFLATFSITAGAITNYYMFACATFALTGPLAKLKSAPVAR